MFNCEKCSICIHDSVCGNKDEYRAACKAVENTLYAHGNSVALVKDTPFLCAKVECRHFKPGTLTRGSMEGSR